MIVTWTSAHCAFAVETFLKTGKSVTATQRTFLLISCCRNDAVLDRKLRLLCVENFRTRLIR